MRILHINSARDWAGGEVHTYLLCRKLDEMGLKITLACKPGSKIDKKFRTEGLAVFNLPLMHSGDILSATALAAYCRINNIDILHVHLARDYWLAYYAKLLYKKLKIVFVRHVAYKVKFRNFLYRHMYDSVDKIIAVSQAVEDVLKGQNVIDEAKIIKIYNGIDHEPFINSQKGNLRKELGINEKSPLVGMIGRVNDEKNQKSFIKSIPIILKSYPEARFIIAGADEENGAYIKKLQALAESLEVSDKLKLLGFRSDVPSIMKELDVFVLASTNEGFGLVLTEALSSGAAVVATPVDCAREIILDGESGIIAEGFEPKNIAEAVDKILSNDELAQKLKKEGQKRARIFELCTMAEKTMEVYKQLL